MFYKVRESYINMRRKPHCRTNKQISTDILLRTNQFEKFAYTLYLKLLSTTKILEFKSNLSCSFLQCCPLTSCSFSHLVSLSACKYLSFTQAFNPGNPAWPVPELSRTGIWHVISKKHQIFHFFCRLSQTLWSTDLEKAAQFFRSKAVEKVYLFSIEA